VASWVEDDARRDALIYRDGPEVWRNLKLSLEQEVGKHVEIYDEPGTESIQFTNCLPISEDCVRIRILTPPVRYPPISFDIRFSVKEKRITCVDTDTKFSLAVESQRVILLDKEGKTVSIEDASRAILGPLFSKLPQRRPNIRL
jgi:hypothetical protein